MNRRPISVPAVLGYFSWIGWIIAFLIRDPSDRFVTTHLNQALVINIIASIAGILNIVPILGSLAYTIVDACVFVLWIMGIYRAFTWRDDPLPFIGEIRLFQ